MVAASDQRPIPPVRWTIITVASVMIDCSFGPFVELPAFAGRITGMSYVPGRERRSAFDWRRCACGALADNLAESKRFRVVDRDRCCTCTDCLVRIFGRCSAATVKPHQFLGSGSGAVIVGLGFAAPVLHHIAGSLRLAAAIVRCRLRSSTALSRYFVR